MVLTVGIAGITGKFAHRVVSHLLKHFNVIIRGYCRDSSKVSESISSEKVTLFKGDAFEKEAIHTFAQGCDVLICCYLGDNKLMIDEQKILIDACEQLGVPRYITSDWALDYTKLKLGELFPKDPVIHVRAYLTTKQKVKGVHILIGRFMEPVLSPFFNILDPKTNSFRFWGEGDEIMEGTADDTAAQFTTAVARDPEATGVIRFLGGRATIREIVQSYEKVYGVKANLERLGSLDDLYKFMHETRAQNPADIYGYMSLFFYYYWINGQTFVGLGLDNDRYPQVKPINWEEYMRQWPLEQFPSSYFALNA
ncbi:NmrA-like family protein [Aspergillus pseudotamarii]|uniref:NmrA-like family protein n=1 Tax=Aspergillus pseudotamarii TaxID=132259 RepID=A0A5N6SRN2_ASPPS|nr:NmrA-like family protein [Aspergillus pseudotamarii]KAE8137346.1 NmrA-like family protein [Aspergillus pseudotamarii]